MVRSLLKPVVAILIGAGVWADSALGQTFEEMVQDALRRHQPGQDPSLDNLTPPAADDAGAGAQPPPAAAPQAAEPPPGPRPYTPPAQAQPQAPADAEAGEAASAGAPPERTLESLSVEEVNAATWHENARAAAGADPLILKAQVLLDRAGASPGVIDAYYGDNVAKAIAAVETVLQLPVDGLLDRDVWKALGGDQAAPVLVSYTITDEDVAGPFVDIPADWSEQAKLERLAYGGPVEMLAERFHMDTDLLKALNPDADFSQAGATITVAAVEGAPIAGTIARIAIDKNVKQLQAYDIDNRLIVAYPATIGSPENPSPGGSHTVESVVPDPFYNYDPANFVQGDNMEKLTLPPGPNNPVGDTWIGLSQPGYGIHGTPEPSRIDKTGSHGCVRLTNWDARELASLVEPGVVVEFLE
jgi:lipoprotein-anchoring transpeptidase ErfK/SrfK